MARMARIAAIAALVPVAAATVVVLGIRAKYPPLVDLVRRFARDKGNPRVMRTAGTAGGQASVIEHVGRVSGRAFRTPVTPTRTPDGFVIALPYGPGTDWVRNVLAAGGATLVHEGEICAVDNPRVIPVAEAAGRFGTRERLFLGVFGVRECLSLQRATDRTDPAGTG